MWPPTGLIPWFSKTEGNTYATLLHHPFLLKGKATHAQEVARRISGTVAGESTHKSRHTKYPSHTLIPRIKLFAICLSFSSPPLHPCRFIYPLSLYTPSLFSVCLFSLAMSEPKRVGGSLPSSSPLDNPAILSKLINRNAI